jgi:exportin-2 (importin alpha re-exporter)
MLALSNPSDKAIRAQVAESVSLIAQLDFPTKWGDLIDVRGLPSFFKECDKIKLVTAQQLVASLSPTDYNVNIGVLETAHSIFRPWRALVRSDELFTEINLVFKTFMTPFLQLFRQTAALLLGSSAPPADLAPMTFAQCLLVDIFYDFTCQDLPPDIEDSHDEFFAPQTGLFQRFLAWDPPALQGDVRNNFLAF